MWLSLDHTAHHCIGCRLLPGSLATQGAGIAELVISQATVLSTLRTAVFTTKSVEMQLGTGKVSAEVEMSRPGCRTARAAAWRCSHIPRKPASSPQRHRTASHNGVYRALSNLGMRQFPHPTDPSHFIVDANHGR
ncbi:hypothetical protein BAUCODRAFT_386331 [Baudoinia panamericana UAMH 10762]|uniref:Uncharacterized protein n=1 Tax=Baudoinia panamericana (strain UAMH 10762) TaxID=717646 RepID=M2LWD4_BAUPA|nr:uncharacterized protein BAUCODRAFT_386331 [Baudoinia panamericana UAMH 10762]EMC98972.1 hypothetical protein BAUCODRAFT_386331 [Baudoinia panamericana UAMH 10762]